MKLPALKGVDIPHGERGDQKLLNVQLVFRANHVSYAHVDGAHGRHDRLAHLAFRLDPQSRPC